MSHHSLNHQAQIKGKKEIVRNPTTESLVELSSSEKVRQDWHQQPTACVRQSTKLKEILRVSHQSLIHRLIFPGTALLYISCILTDRLQAWTTHSPPSCTDSILHVDLCTQTHTHALCTTCTRHCKDTALHENCRKTAFFSPFTPSKVREYAFGHMACALPPQNKNTKSKTITRISIRHPLVQYLSQDSITR